MHSIAMHLSCHRKIGLVQVLLNIHINRGQIYYEMNKVIGKNYQIYFLEKLQCYWVLNPNFKSRVETIIL